MRYLLIVPFIFSILSCSDKPAGRDLSILTYNLYLMFDDNEDGDEYHPFTPSSGYDGDSYARRISGYADLLCSQDYLSDIFLFQEVESSKVLEDLIKAGLIKHGHKFYGIAENDNPISVGFISRIKPKAIYIHGSGGPRPIMELQFIISGELVSIFVIHAKSRLDGGGGERCDQFMHLSYLMGMASPSLAVACGDFNEDPRYDENLAPSYVEPQPALMVSGDASAASGSVFYSAVLDGAMPAMDTYHYEGRWYSYDHILLNHAAFDGSGLELKHMGVVAPRDVVSGNGVPTPFDVYSSSGYSDHLAVRAVFGYH